MENYKDLIQYFNSINIDVEDVTTDLEKENFQKIFLMIRNIRNQTKLKIYYNSWL